jgi:recombinational DNA repair protein (RecF pathway)
MRVKVEGLLISKIPFGDKHFIAKLLLRNGKKISVVFYGARGAGKKRTSSLADLGHMLAVELGRAKYGEHLYPAKEWSLIWAPKKIREDYKAFSLMSLYFEIVAKFCLEDHLETESDEHDGPFRVLSNAVFFLEDSLKKGAFNPYEQLLLFLGKVFQDQGIFPKMGGCIFCDRSLEHVSQMSLVFEQGGFSCSLCLGPQSEGVGRDAWKFLNMVRSSSYQDFSFKTLEFQSIKSLCQLLLGHFCYQFHLEERQFRALPMVL